MTSYRGNRSYSTYANRFESGDHEFTLIVPCPPKNFVNTSNLGVLSRLPGACITRRTTPSILSLCPVVPFGKENTSSHLPFGEKCGNQSSSSSLVTRSALASL